MACLTFTVALPALIVSDSFFVLEGGRFIAQHGLPHHDMLTVIPYGREWIDQQWLAHLLFYEVDRAGGLIADAVLAALAGGGAVGLLVGGLRMAGLAPIRTTVLGIVAIVELFPYASARAQVLVLPLFVALFVLLDRARARPALAWWSLAILVVWANLHGSVVAG